MSFGRDDDDNENKQHSNQLHIKHLASYSLLQKVVIVFSLQKEKKKFCNKKRRKKSYEKIHDLIKDAGLS